MKTKKPIIQRHHLFYGDANHEVVVPMFKGEHFLITNLNRRKNISLGFIQSLKIWLTLNECNAIDLA